MLLSFMTFYSVNTLEERAQVDQKYFKMGELFSAVAGQTKVVF